MCPESADVWLGMGAPNLFAQRKYAEGTLFRETKRNCGANALRVVARCAGCAGCARCARCAASLRDVLHHNLMRHRFRATHFWGSDRRSRVDTRKSFSCDRANALDTRLCAHYIHERCARRRGTSQLRWSAIRDAIDVRIPRRSSQEETPRTLDAMAKQSRVREGDSLEQ